jgi:hypothetical protein
MNEQQVRKNLRNCAHNEKYLWFDLFILFRRVLKGTTKHPKGLT